MLAAEARSLTAAREILILLHVDPAVGLTRQTVDLAQQWAPARRLLTPFRVERGSRRHKGQLQSRASRAQYGRNGHFPGEMAPADAFSADQNSSSHRSMRQTILLARPGPCR